MPRNPRVYLCLVLLSLQIFSGASSRATITVVSYWRMGEIDPGAAAGLLVTNTIDSVGTNNLTFQGLADYTNDVAPSAALYMGSSLSVNFTGAYATNAIVSTAIDNFGIECWVKPTALGGGQVIAYNGSTSGLGSGGWGIVIAADNTFEGLFGGVAAFGTNVATTNVWTHVALVRDQGVATLYVNGNITAFSTAAPSVPTGNFALATAPQAVYGQFFHGLLDEVRVFTFEPRAFTTNDLLWIPGPIVTTLPATPIGLTNAELNGTLNPNSFDAGAWFQYGMTADYGDDTPLIFISATNVAAVPFSALVNQLSPNTSYHFRLVATNLAGTNYGNDQTFSTPIVLASNTALPVFTNGSVAWGDYDNDGQVDVLLCGEGESNLPITQLWRNTGNGFTNINAGFPGVENGSVAWGDYDNDGRLDILLCGDTGPTLGNPIDEANPITQVWRNTGHGFTNINAGLPGVFAGTVAWGDYDNDGRLDILLCGSDGTNYITQVWRNTGNGFTNINAGLPGVVDGSAAWGDYDNDGRLDILLCGAQNVTNALVPITQVWRNTGSGFTNINVGLPGVFEGSAAWGDYDNDGRLDILLCGTDGSNYPSAQVWRNTGSGFTNINAGLPGVFEGSAAWGDYDNDGRLDILLCGYNSSFVPITQVWRNTGSGFAEINYLPNSDHPLPAVWGDYHNDGRLDFLLSDNDATQLWFDEIATTNSPPTAPTGLSAARLDSSLTLSWNASSDLQTPVSGLSYNLRIGSAPGGSDILAPMANTNGMRLLPQRGSIQSTQFTLSAPRPGTTYYWSVQSIDTSFASSPFAPEASFLFLPSFAGSSLTSDGTFAAQFNVQGGTNYTIQTSTDLVHWIDLFNFTSGGSVPFQFTDPDATNYPQRFYRFGQH